MILARGARMATLCGFAASLNRFSGLLGTGEGVRLSFPGCRPVSRPRCATYPSMSDQPSPRPAQPASRRPSVEVKIGKITVGGGAPIVVQSMTNTDTEDPASTAKQ